MSVSLRDAALGLTEVAVPSAAPTATARLEEEVVGLFEQFRERLLRYLIALGLTACDGEEVVQEVFLALFQHLRRDKPRSNLQGWIFRVAHNLGLKQRNRTRKHISQTADICRTGAGLAASPGQNPEEQMLHDERQTRLRAVVQALPERDRWCLYLRAEGLRYREIAETLEISLGAVSLSLGRSLARLARVDGR